MRWCLGGVCVHRVHASGPSEPETLSNAAPKWWDQRTTAQEPSAEIQIRTLRDFNNSDSCSCQHQEYIHLILLIKQEKNSDL